MTTLSVVAPCRNEARDLPHFLSCLLSWVDEIIIVDDASEDNSCQIAESYGSKVKVLRQVKHSSDFAALRNIGMTAALGDWLLFLDIDMLTPIDFIQEVSEAINNESKDAYYFGMKHFFLGHEIRFSGIQFWRKPWLVRKEKGSWINQVHETLVLNSPANRIGRIKSRIVHLGDEFFVERLHKNILYSELSVQSGKTRPRKTGIIGALFYAFLVSLRTFFIHRGFMDGKAGFFWACYLFSSTLNRELLAIAPLITADRNLLIADVQQKINHIESTLLQKNPS